jgi:hypothetical protein
MHVRKRTRGHGRHEYFYACTSHFNRGESICRNLVQIPMQAIDDKVIRGITNLLRPELVEIIVSRVREALEPDYQDRLRKQLAEQLADVDRQTANVADAIAIGGDVPALLSKLQALAQRRAELLQQQQALGDAPLLPRVDVRLMERRARALLKDWRGLLTRHPSDARGVLRQLLAGPMLFTPILEKHRRGFQFDGAVRVGEMLTGYVGNDVGVPGQN